MKTIKFLIQLFGLALDTKKCLMETTTEAERQMMGIK